MTEQYKPDLLTIGSVEFAKFIVRVFDCRHCNRKCVKTVAHHNDPFPYGANDYASQAKAAGLGFIVSSWGKGWMCVDCFAKDAESFKCAMCGESRPCSRVKESFGYPPEHLCVTCFETKTAKAWEEIQHRLYEEHKYDHE